MKLVILGPPRTKKNSLRRLKRGHRVFTVGSEAAFAWEQSAVNSLMLATPQRPFRVLVNKTVKIGKRKIKTKHPLWFVLPDAPHSVRALVYRDADRGDLVGYLQAIGDALEKSGVIANDRLIASWDGSRLLKDAARPRVELWIEPFEEGDKE